MNTKPRQVILSDEEFTCQMRSLLRNLSTNAQTGGFKRYREGILKKALAAYVSSSDFLNDYNGQEPGDQVDGSLDFAEVASLFNLLDNIDGIFARYPNCEIELNQIKATATVYRNPKVADAMQLRK